MNAADVLQAIPTPHRIRGDHRRGQVAGHGGSLDAGVSPPPHPRLSRRFRLVLIALLVVMLTALAPPEPVRAGTTDDLPDGGWLWPVAGPRTVIAPFRAPAHAYGPGHRGMDIAAAGEVLSPAAGVIAFRGTVVDRPLVTIDHGNGLVTTLEPLDSALAPGTPVARGDPVGTTAIGGHAPAGALHIGVRWNGAYINPLLLFDEVPRAILLPCGAGGC